jgi:hypothetical protein
MNDKRQTRSSLNVVEKYKNSDFIFIKYPPMQDSQ